MRALAGNYIELADGTKEAFVVRCNQLRETDSMIFNGSKYTWTEFKAYWAKKDTGGWLYDDISNSKEDEKDKRRFEEAWRIAGPLYCQKKGIIYADYSDAQKQKAQKQKVSSQGTLHFIFALD